MPAIAGTNKFQVDVYRPPVPIDYSNTHAPTTQSIHGFGIRVGGVYIGRINNWTPSEMDRAITAVKELHPKTWGQPVDAVPGGTENFQVTFARAEVWNEEVEKAFGENDVYALLTNQTAPFAIDEMYFRGTELYRQWRYLGCWFNSKATDMFDAEGDGIIRINGSLTFVNKIPVV